MPLPKRHMVDVLLSAHLAFAACRSGHGSRHLLFELVHATYLSYFLWKDGFGEANHHLYSIAEKALDEAANEGYKSGIWEIRPEAEEGIRQILRVYDVQVRTVPLGALGYAKARLRQLFERFRGTAIAG